MIITEEKYLSDLLEVIREVTKNPGVFLGEISLTKFRSFIDGFSAAYTKIDSEHKPFRFYPGFQKWTAEKYNIKSSQSWNRIILFYSASEKEAFELFKKDFDKFLNECNHQ